MKKTLIISCIIILVFTIFSIYSNFTNFITFEYSHHSGGIAGSSGTYKTYELGYMNFNSDSYNNNVVTNKDVIITKHNNDVLDINEPDFYNTYNTTKTDYTSSYITNIFTMLLTDIGIFILCSIIYRIYELLKSNRKIIKFISTLGLINIAELLFLGVIGIFPATLTYNISGCGGGIGSDFCVYINNNPIDLHISPIFIFILAFILTCIFNNFNNKIDDK